MIKIIQGMKLLILNRWSPKWIIIVTILIFLSNIFLPVIIQWVLSGATPITINFNGVIKEGNKLIHYLIMFKSPYKLGGQLAEQLSGETYLYIIYTTNEILLYLLVSILASIAICTTLYYSRLSKGSCRLEKSGMAAGSAATVVGFSTLASSIVSCPSCGFSMAATLASIGVASATGSTLGISRTFINLLYFSSILGVLINVGIILYMSWKAASLIH